MRELNLALQQAADLIGSADALMITAGAGMGVDSGLPDFRGNEGMWQAYPALGRARIDFTEIANPQAFADDPQLAWGFYGHRLKLYRDTVPHAGFALLQQWASTMSYGAFVFTSNVDGQFQRAGFHPDRLIECHGSIHHLQCSSGCDDIWPADAFTPTIDAQHCRLLSPLPRCPHCGALARPNILMFDDWHWLEQRTEAQQRRYRQWRSQSKQPVIIEIGAGTAIPSVRHFGEQQPVPLIRINKREAAVRRADDIAIPLGGLEALQQLQKLLD